MAKAKPFKAEVKTNAEGKTKTVEVLSATDNKDATWKIKHRRNWLFFDKKESVKTYLERKYPNGVEGVE